MPVIFDHGKFPLYSPQFYWPRPSGRRLANNPIEDAGADLVREIARVGWDIPGIDVKVDTYGGGADLIRCVSRISGMTDKGPFRLDFDGSQGRLGRFSIVTGLEAAVVPPGVEIRFYSDHSGPTAYLYTGKDWVKDGAAWIASAKVNSKLRGEPKTYLRYSGKGNGSILAHDDDLGREYSPSRREPKSLNTKAVAADVAALVGSLMARLKQMPSAPGWNGLAEGPDVNLERLAAVERIPAPADFPELYCWVESNDAYRLAGRDPDDGVNTYGLSGNGWRLAAYGVGHGELPDRAHDSFSYASTDPAVQAGQVMYGVRDDSLPVIVNLKWLNDVFVVDNAAYRHAKAAMVESIKNDGRDRISDSELDACVAATARTMVPVTDYAGGFEEPVYLIGRQTEVEEVRLVRGPVTMIEREGGFSVIVTDQPRGLDFTIFDRSGTGDYTRNNARMTAEQAGRLLSDGRFRSRELEAQSFSP